ncbi:MAG: STAS domain-containing protein, partial [Acetobacteraceae bacterium]
MSGAAPAGLEQRSDPAGARLVLSGALETATLGRLWRRAPAAARAARGGVLLLDLAAVTHCDTAGAVFLLALAAAHGGEVRFAGVAEETEKLLARVRALPVLAPP